MWLPATDKRLLRTRGSLTEVQELNAQKTDGGGELVDLELRDSTGLRVSCLMKLPPPQPDPRPAVVILGGFVFGRRVVELVPYTRNAVVLSADYPFSTSGGEGKLGLVAVLPKLRQGAYRTLGSLLLILDYLSSRSDVDKKRITLIGASLGSPFAAIVGSIDPRVAGMVLLFGGGLAHRLVSLVIPGQSNRLRSVFGHVISWYGAPGEPCRFIGRFSPRPLLMINGTGDEQIPTPCSQALYECAREPKEVVWLKSGHLQSQRDELLVEVEGIVEEWMVRRGLL